MKRLESIDHDSTDRLRTMELAREYGRTLYTGVFYRDPTPPPTLEELVAERQRALAPKAMPRGEIVQAFPADDARYSCRKASIGSASVARRAGR
jgi:hypothetical protein